MQVGQTIFYTKRDATRHRRQRALKSRNRLAMTRRRNRFNCQGRYPNNVGIGLSIFSEARKLNNPFLSGIHFAPTSP